MLTATQSLNFYLDELARRERARSTRLALWISLGSLGIAAVSVVVAFAR